MADVFLSYARTTADVARVVARELRGAGFRVWSDEELPAHLAYADVIEQRIADAGSVLVLWSCDAVRSTWVRSEANRARESGKVVQAMIEDVALPMPFDQIQCADLRGWKGDSNAHGWRKVLESLAALLDRRREADPGTQIVDVPPAARQPVDMPVLAVLAFDDLSREHDMRYFSDGISEEIQHAVARQPGMRVIARASSFQFRGAEKAVANVASVLHASHLLDGSVRRHGHTARIAAQLVDCRAGTTVWSARYDRDISDVLAVQDEIAEAIAGALSTAFAPLPRGGPIAVEATELFMRARELKFRGMFVENSHDVVIALLERAVAAEPRYTRAWAELARVRSLRWLACKDAPLRPVMRDRALEAAHRAIDLGPRDGAAAQVALSMLQPAACYVEKASLLSLALAAAPNDPDALLGLVVLNEEVGCGREAMRLARRAFELDPLDPRVTNAWAITLGAYGTDDDYDASQAIFARARARWPRAFWCTWNALNAAAHRGDWARFDALLEEADASGLAMDTTSGSALLFEYVRAWRTPDAAFEARLRVEIESAIEHTGTVPIHLLTCAVTLGLVEQAFAAAERAVFDDRFDADGTPRTTIDTLAVFFWPSFSAFRRDPRFVSLCTKLGLCSYWAETDRWPDDADALDVLYDFRARVRAGAAARKADAAAREMATSGDERAA